MGKKKKENWDLSVEEQLRRADELYAYEMGKINTLGGKDDEYSDINESGLSSNIEKLIVEDMIKKGEYTAVENTARKQPLTNMEKLLGSKPRNDNKIKENINECRKIVFDTRHTDELSKVIITDGISPTTISLALAVTEDLDVAVDADDVYEKINTLYDYTITQKYPTAIYTEEEFRKDYSFGRVKDGTEYNTTKFYFFASQGYVLCYAIDTLSVGKFKSILEENGYDSMDLLKTYLSIADNSSNVMESFFPLDEWYIQELYNSSYNQKEEFHKLFINDNKTFIVKEEYVTDGIDGIDADECRLIVEDGDDIISYLKGMSLMDGDETDMEVVYQELVQDVLKDTIDAIDDFYGDDVDIVEEDEKEEVNEPEVLEVETTEVVTETPTEVNIKETTTVSTTNEPKEVIAEIEAELSDLLSDDMEVIEEKTVTKLKTTEEGDPFKIPVVRRK